MKQVTSDNTPEAAYVKPGTSSVGERLRLERERLDLTQQQLADATKVSQRSQIEYESGRREPKLSYLAALPSVGVDLPYVLSGLRTVTTDLSSAEQFLINTYRRLGPGQTAISVLFEFLAGHPFVQGQMQKHKYEKAEKTAVALPSQSIYAEDLERERMHDCIQVLEEIVQRRKLKLPPIKFARACLLLYEKSRELGSMPPVHSAQRLLETVEAE